MTQQRAEYPLDYSKGPSARPTVETAADTVTDQMSRVAENAQDVADNVMRQARQYGEKAQDAVQNFKPFMEKSMKDQPMTTLAAAAALGFLLGAVWKR